MQLRSIILLNCGALVDWTQSWFAEESINTYIFDSHRPFNHNNIHTKKTIFVIDDGEIPPLELIPDDDDIALAQVESEAEEEPDEDENLNPNSEE